MTETEEYSNLEKFFVVIICVEIILIVTTILYIFLR